MKRTVATLLVFLLLLMSGLVFWGRDETLSPMVVPLIQSPKTVDGDNAYFSLLGFRAPADKNSAELGRRMLAQYQVNAQLATQRYEAGIADSLLKQVSGSEGIHFSENVSSLCDNDPIGVVACVVQNRAQIGKTLSDNKILLERYVDLLHRTAFSDVAAGSGISLAPPFVDLQRAKSALWAKSILLIKDGRVEQGLDMLQADIRFWRMLFVQSDNLLVHMVAVSMLHGQYELLSRIVTDFPTIGVLGKDRLRQMSIPFSATELSFRRALAGELRLAATVLQQFDQPSQTNDTVRAPDCADKKDKKCVGVSQPTNWSLAHPFWRKTPLYRHNATLNLQANLLAQWAGFSELSAQQLIRQRELFTQALEKEYKPGNFSTFAVYNRIGRQLVADGFADMNSHLLKLHDLDGLVRLVNLQFQIVALGLPDERIGPFLQTSDATLTNPYTGEAMLWDSKERTLSFAARGREEGGEVAVVLGRLLDGDND